MPEISIIVPVYNVEKYVKQCLQSILNQTFSDFEVIIIDDGSSDQSGKICDDFARLNSKITVLHTENEGLASARNKGLDRAKGDYICFVDSDDYLQENYLEFLYRIIQNSEYDFVSCAANFVDEQGKLIRRNDYLVSEKEIVGDEIIDIYMTTNLIEDASWNKLYKKTVWQDLRFLEGYIYEDSEIIVRLLQRCKTIFFTSEFLYYYRIRSDSILSYEGKSIYKKKYKIKNLHLLSVYESRAKQLRGTKWEVGCYRQILLLCGEFIFYHTFFPKEEQEEVITRCREYFRKYKSYLWRKHLFTLKERMLVFCEVRYPGILGVLWKRG